MPCLYSLECLVKGYIFPTTLGKRLSSRSNVPWIMRCFHSGYWEQVLFLILCDLWAPFPPIISISLPSLLVSPLPDFRWFPQMHVLISTQQNTWGSLSADPWGFSLCVPITFPVLCPLNSNHLLRPRFPTLYPQRRETTGLCLGSPTLQHGL